MKYSLKRDIAIILFVSVITVILTIVLKGTIRELVKECYYRYIRNYIVIQKDLFVLHEMQFLG